VGAAKKKKKGSTYEAEEEEEEEEDGDASGSGDELDGIFESDSEGGGRDGGGGEDGQDDDDEEDEEDGGEEARRQQLLAKVRGRSRGDEDDVSSGYVPAAAEGEFSATSTAKSLSLSALLAGSTRAKSSVLKSVATELTKMERKKSVAVPAPAVVTARATREAAYMETSKTVTNWQSVVKQNREKEQLSFPLKEPGRHNVTSASLVDKFKPRTSLEEDIARIVKAAGADEETLRKTEEMELRKLDVNEVKARQAELAKMRSLLFHAEIKAKRINKIKSKKFHKVDRKYKEKAESLADHELEKVDPEAYRERLEAREKKRAEERLTLKHKNTSKWVKHMLGRAYGDDAHEETREAIQEQLNKGESLRQKQLRGADSDEEKSADETAADIEVTLSDKSSIQSL
jgi:U3 small nucleolar RNA-associated protein 14